MPPRMQTRRRILSVLTGGLRQPICDFASYDVVLNHIAREIIASARTRCDFALPAAPSGATLDPASVSLTFTPSTGAPVTYPQVADLAACTDRELYVDAGSAVLCPSACSDVAAEAMPLVDVSFGCVP